MKLGAPVVTYEYDSASRMIQRTEGGTTTNYTWDGWDLIREEKTGTVTETTDYLVPFGEVLALERGGDWYYLHGDALSSTQLVTDESGNIVGRYIYGAWGEELHTSESIPGLLENKFVGGLGCRRDTATGLVYMRHRWYDPELQRFISRDPIGFSGGVNLYSYGSNSPVRFVDPSGLEGVTGAGVGAWVVQTVRHVATEGVEIAAGAATRSVGYTGRTPVPLHIKAALIASGILADIAGTGLGSASTWAAQNEAAATAVTSRKSGNQSR